MPFTKAALVSDIPQGQGKQVSVGGKSLALFNIGGSFYAIDNECPHRNGPLAEGIVSNLEVECPWHGAHFNVSTGANLSPPATQGVNAYKVQVVGDEVQVDV